MTENERLQRLAERIQEDERLRGDLEDDLASALLAWAIERVEVAAADPARPDAEVEPEVQAIRAAAQAAARSGESDPQRLITLAEAGLAQRLGRAVASAPTAGTPPPAVAMSVPVAEQQRPEATQAPQGDQPATPADKNRSEKLPLIQKAPAAAPTQDAVFRIGSEPRPQVRKRRRNRIANWLKRKRGGR